MVQLQLRVVDRVNRWRGKRDGNAGSDFEQVAAKKCRVVGTAARDEDDQMNVARLEHVAESGDLGALFRDRALECGRLLGDLGKH